MTTDNDILIAAFQATLRARIRAVGVTQSFQSMGEEAMSQAIDATEGAMLALKHRGMLTEPAEPEPEDCQHPEDRRSSTTAGGTRTRFYCGTCERFLEDAGNGEWVEYQKRSPI